MTGSSVCIACQQRLDRLGEHRVEGRQGGAPWRRTMTDEAWRQVKQQWNSEVEQDV